MLAIAKLAWRGVAIQVHPDAPAYRHQQASPWPAFSMRSRSSDEKRRQGAISYSSRFHLSEPFGRGDALNRLADATAKPVRDTLG